MCCIRCILNPAPCCRGTRGGRGSGQSTLATRVTASKRRGNNLKGLHDVYLKVRVLTVLHVPYSLYPQLRSLVQGDPWGTGERTINTGYSRGNMIPTPLHYADMPDKPVDPNVLAPPPPSLYRCRANVTHIGQPHRNTGSLTLPLQGFLARKKLLPPQGSP